MTALWTVHLRSRVTCAPRLAHRCSVCSAGVPCVSMQDQWGDQSYLRRAHYRLAVVELESMQEHPLWPWSACSCPRAKVACWCITGWASMPAPGQISRVCPPQKDGYEKLVTGRVVTWCLFGWCSVPKQHNVFTLICPDQGQPVRRQVQRKHVRMTICKKLVSNDAALQTLCLLCRVLSLGALWLVATKQ